MSYNKSIHILISILILSMVSCDERNNSRVDTGPDFIESNIQDVQSSLYNSRSNVEEVVRFFLNRINEIDENGPELNSIICINPDAMNIARQLDKELSEGKSRGPLHGIPVILKDNIDTHDKMPTTAGSRALADSYPLQDSWVAKKLRDAGAVIIAKANLSEWANFRGEMSSSGWSGVGGQTKNPYDLSRNPCGSSSGSGVAVAASLCMVAIGTETNGSIVCPSSSNGIVGIKPTVGLVSRSGVIPISFTQDIPGPMARNVYDAALCLGALTGIDSSDSKTFESEGKYYKDYTQFLNKDGINGKRIGVYKKPFGLNYKVDEKMNVAISFLKSQGATIIEVDKLYEDFVGDLSFEIMLFEYKDGLNKYFASLGPDAKIKNLDELIAFNELDSIEMMFYKQEYLVMANSKPGLDSPIYKETLRKMQKAVREDGIDKVMDEFRLDCLIAPTGGPAWKTDHTNGDSYHVGSSSPAAIAGYPNITVPMGYIDGLPVGISFFGRAWSEPLLLEIAYSYEQGTLHRKEPGYLNGND